MPTNSRGRSPSRTNTKTPQKKRVSSIPRTSGVFSKTPRMSQDAPSPRNSGWSTIADYMESGKRRNTPEHLYGIDRPSDILVDDDGFLRDKKVMKSRAEEDGKKMDPGKIWYQLWSKQILVLIIAILIGIQAFLFLKERDLNFGKSNLNTDVSICLRSHEELRRKLAMAFELINESGKLFKQLERQSKQEIDSLDVKLANSISKYESELEEMKREIEVLKINNNLRDPVDFRKYSEKDVPADLIEVHAFVEMAMLQHDADKIGIPDYALESAGGRIHVPYHSQTHSSGSPIMKVFGIVVWGETKTPRELIKPENLPGNCWPMDGSSGYVVIKLALPIIPSMVTMEHMHPSLSKFSKASWESIPKNFTVFGWLDENGKEKVSLGSYVYIQGSKSRQTFPVQVLLEQTIEYVQLQIESNYGNPDYTCIYRFRVHGSPLEEQNNEIDIN